MATAVQDQVYRLIEQVLEDQTLTVRRLKLLGETNADGIAYLRAIVDVLVVIAIFNVAR